jgi:hypothetical protein
MMKKTEVLSLLSYWLKNKAAIFYDYKEYILGEGKERRIFIDRGSDILFVAHIDTVCTPRLKKHQGNRIWAAGLDDRLGCGLAYVLSAKYKTDLLICDFEEAAASSGQYHNLKDYNWIAEFDRNGGDVVTYDLDNDEFLAQLNKYFEIGWGTFSDLCLLNTSACCVNIGIGYQHDHSEDSYVDLAVLNNQLHKFQRFYDACNLMKFEQDPEKMKYNHWGYEHIYGNSFYDNDIYDNYRECDYCGNIGSEEVWGTRICQQCFETLEANYLYSNHRDSEYQGR